MMKLSVLAVDVEKALYAKGTLPTIEGWNRVNLSYLGGKVKGVLYTYKGNSIKFLQQNKEKQTGKWWQGKCKEGHNVTQVYVTGLPKMSFHWAVMVDGILYDRKGEKQIK